MNDDRKLFKHIHDHIEMHIMEESYISTIAYLEGYDKAKSNKVFKGFKEWLILKHDGSNNLHWPSLVLDIVFPNEDDPIKAVRESFSSQRYAIDRLFELISQFELHKDQYGVEYILENYKEWLKKQSWLDG